MPEGPEVQIQVDQLNKLKGWKVNNLWLPDQRWKGKRKKLENLIGCELANIDRRAKYLIFNFTKQAESFYIINHLSMSGGWLFRNNLNAKSPIHTRLSLSFSKDDESLIVDFVDARHFGRLDLYESAEFWGEKIQSKLSNLGPDALNESVTHEILNQRIHDFTENDPRWEIKPLLMEQTFLSGIGNVYASEICFLAGVNPFRKAATLTQEEIHNLEEAIPYIMKAAYSNGGSTIKTYKSPDGKSGWADRMIYGMKYCRICKNPVSKGPQSGRSTYWCSKCQVM